MTNLRFCSTRLIPLDEMDGHRPGTLITRADTASCCVDVNSVPSVRCGFVSDRRTDGRLRRSPDFSEIPAGAPDPPSSQLGTVPRGARADVGTTPSPRQEPCPPPRASGCCPSQPDSLCRGLENDRQPMCPVVSPVMQSGCRLSRVGTYNRRHHFTESGLRNRR